jgi:hypothetical protein
MIIHESKPHIPVLFSPPKPIGRIQRQPGYRNVVFGKQQQLWRNTIKQHRAIQNRHASENINNIGNELIYPVNIHGSNWNIQPGESASNTIPKNLLPPPRVFRHPSRTRTRRRTRRYHSHSRRR